MTCYTSSLLLLLCKFPSFAFLFFILLICIKYPRGEKKKEKMKLLPLATAFWASTAAATSSGFGSDLDEVYYPGYDGGDDRHIVTIRPSLNDTDDVSSEFLQGITEANHGGRLLLKEGETYIIGKTLELTFLDDIEVQLDGELKVIFIPTYLSMCFVVYP